MSELNFLTRIHFTRVHIYISFYFNIFNSPLMYINVYSHVHTCISTHTRTVESSLLLLLLLLLSIYTLAVVPEIAVLFIRVCVYTWLYTVQFFLSSYSIHFIYLFIRSNSVHSALSTWAHTHKHNHTMLCMYILIWKRIVYKHYIKCFFSSSSKNTRGQRTSCSRREKNCGFDLTVLKKP